MKDTTARFWTMVDTSAGLDACWPWLGNIGIEGYGILSVDGNPRTAHALAYEVAVGPIPSGLALDHRCHTDDLLCPGGSGCLHRRCANPGHLEPVTAAENTLRGRGPTAINARKTHCHRGHEFTAENTTIRLNGSRECRPCNRSRQEAALIALMDSLGAEHPCAACGRSFPTPASLHIHLSKSHPGPATDAVLHEVRLASGRAKTRRYEERQRLLADLTTTAAL